MISRVPVLLIALTLLWCDPLIPRSHAQQGQTVTPAVQVIGIVGVKEKTKGTLSLVNGALRFSHAKGNADVTAASIQDVVTGRDSQRVIGGTLGTVSHAEHRRVFLRRPILIKLSPTRRRRNHEA